MLSAVWGLSDLGLRGSGNKGARHTGQPFLPAPCHLSPACLSTPLVPTLTAAICPTCPSQAASKPGYVPPMQRPEVRFIPSLLDDFLEQMQQVRSRGTGARGKQGKRKGGQSSWGGVGG